MPPRVLLFGLLIASSAFCAEHPRLFFDKKEIPAMQAKADKSPWKDMLTAIEWAVENDLNNGYDRGIPRPANSASLHLFRGSSKSDHATIALNDCLYLLFAPDKEGKPVWSQPGYKSLTRAGRAIQVLLSYDLCHDAWTGRKIPAEFPIRDGRKVPVPPEYVGQDVNATISKLLKDNADSLVKSGGSGWPGDQKLGNNWLAVRFGTAALSYLACDEPRETWQANFDTAIRMVIKHKQANLSKNPRANGWNPEGIAYAQYPGWTTYPLVIALRRLEGRDLIREVPAMERELWATYQGVLPLPRRSRVSTPGDSRQGYGLGLRPDFTDDHPVWEGEGTAGLAFAVAPAEYLPGLKWMYRRLCGDLGDRTWDTASGHGLYSLLFYPADLEEKNPAEVWGRTWKDEAFGMFLFRNRFQDGDDFVLQTVAKLRPTFGGHEGRDALSFRLWGLGVPWAVGSGRTSDHRGQTSLFPGDPEEGLTPPSGLVPSVPKSFLRRNGDGYVVMNMVLSDTGVSNHTRRLVVDYSGESGAPALILVSDSSEDGRFWRMNTPDFLSISTGPNTFTLTSPQGHQLTATILWPPSGVTPRVGKFQRGSPFPYADTGYKDDDSMGTASYTTQNSWVDFESPDGKFLVAITVVPKGTPPPTVSAKGRGTKQTVQVGKRTIQLDDDEITVDGWTRPDLQIVTPSNHQHFHGESPDVPISGTIKDPDGIESVSVRLNGQPPSPAKVAKDGTWSLVLPSVPPGIHELEVQATDRVADQTTALTSFQVNRTLPPVLSWDDPAKTLTVKPGESITLEGTVKDPEGGAVGVAIFAGDQEVGKASVEGERFRFTWKAVPIGTFALRAVATDAAGDSSNSSTVEITAPWRIGKGNVSEATRLWVGENPESPSPVGPKSEKGFHPRPQGTERWSIQEVDGRTVLRVREVQKWDFRDRNLWIRDSAGVKNWRLEWKMKMESPLDTRPEAFVNFGAGIEGPLTMDFRPVESVKFDSPRKRTTNTTRLWYLAPNGNRPEIGWTVTAHTQADEGFPEKPGTTSAGIPDAEWHAYAMERKGRSLKVWRDGRLILESDSPWVASPGPVGFSNERTAGSTYLITDLSFTPL